MGKDSGLVTDVLSTPRPPDCSCSAAQTCLPSLRLRFPRGGHGRATCDHWGDLSRQKQAFNYLTTLKHAMHASPAAHTPRHITRPSHSSSDLHRVARRGPCLPSVLSHVGHLTNEHSNPAHITQTASSVFHHRRSPWRVWRCDWDLAGTRLWGTML